MLYGEFSRDNYSEQEHNLRTNPDLNCLGHLHPLDFPVKAKELGFDIRGYETRIDYERMLHIISEFDFDGYFSVEYEGMRHSEEEEILATRALIEQEI